MREFNSQSKIKRSEQTDQKIENENQESGNTMGKNSKKFEKAIQKQTKKKDLEMMKQCKLSSSFKKAMKSKAVDIYAGKLIFHFRNLHAYMTEKIKHCGIHKNPQVEIIS